MSKIFILMGKSATGKDTIMKKLVSCGLKTMILYTTRPIRDGEKEGREYHYISQDRFKELKREGKVIESRTYDTAHGRWTYISVDDGAIDLATYDYVVIGTIETLESYRSYYGADRVIPIYVEVDDGERLQRAIEREKTQDSPKYVELCRRFLADAEDYSEDKLKEAGVEENNRFVNEELDACVKRIGGFIREKM